MVDVEGVNWIQGSLLSAFFAGSTAVLAKAGVTSVVFVILLAARFLKEKMTIQHWLGGVLIASGAVVMTSKSSKA